MGASAKMDEGKGERGKRVGVRVRAMSFIVCIV